MKQIILIVVFMIGAVSVQAAIPRSIAYQGIVSDLSGNPKPDGNYTFVFSLFADSAGGSSLWSESKVLPVKNGIVSTTFGSQTTPLTISFDSKYWLEISVNGALLAGRVPLTSSAYALRADTADVAKRLANVASGGSASFSGVVSSDSGYFAKGIQGQRLYVPVARIDSILSNTLTINGVSSWASPIYQLNVNGSTFSNNYYIANTGLIKTTNDSCGMMLRSNGNISFYNGGVDRVNIDISGKMGIGKTPSCKLDVAGAIHSDSGISTNYGCYAYNNAGQGSYIGLFKQKGALPGYDNTNFPVIKTDNDYMYLAANDKYVGAIGHDGKSSYFLLTDTSNQKHSIWITSNSKSYFDGGPVGIGTTDPGDTYKLYVNGSLYATSGPWASSDLRLKTNIDTIRNSIETIKNLTGVQYNWKTAEYPDRNLPSGRQIGLIAQDVEKVLPEVVQTNTDGYKAVSYDKIVAVLIEAVKAQHHQIDSLKNVIINTQSSIMEIKTKLQ